MTNEEAIEHLNTIGQYYSQDHSDPYEECEVLTKDELDAIYMAINALEREQKFLDAGYKNGRVEFMIGGRKFMVKEMAQ